MKSIKTPLEPPLTAHEEVVATQEIVQRVQTARAWILENNTKTLAKNTWACLQGLAESSETEEENIPCQLFFVEAIMGKVVGRLDLNEAANASMQDDTSPLDDLAHMLPRTSHGAIWFCINGPGIIITRFNDGPFMCLEKGGSVIVNLLASRAVDLQNLPDKAVFWPTIPGFDQLQLMSEYGEQAILTAAEMRVAGRITVHLEKGVRFLVHDADRNPELIGVIM